MGGPVRQAPRVVLNVGMTDNGVAMQLGGGGGAGLGGAHGLGMALSPPLSRSASAPATTSVAGRQDWRPGDLALGLPPHYRCA